LVGLRPTAAEAIMAIGIDPTNDYAFKRMFGDNAHSSITRHFLNSVLDPKPRIAQVDIRNPVLDKEHEDDKLALLDILARDENGRQFNIEMQTTLPLGLSQRLAYYASTLYASQLKEGMNYTDLRPAASICVLRRSLFPQIEQIHFDFRLRQADGLLLTDDLQIHLVELAKSRATRDNLKEVGPIEIWAYFMRNVEGLDLKDVKSLFTDPVFHEAAEVLQMIARTPDEREIYLSHRKAEMDAAANLQYALREGAEIGEIRFKQRMLGIEPFSLEELSELSLNQLGALAAELESQLRDRGMLP
jgi:predicted transposase/invertase (TIGR01784 family)